MEREPLRSISRRDFIGTTLCGSALLASGATAFSRLLEKRKPNVLFVFADEWRAHDLGYNGNKDVHTPNLDSLSRQSINCSNMISGCPVCTPYRASLLTGQYWLTHGAFVNDKPLGGDAVSIAQSFKEAGYDTAYVGKWHVDGRGRTRFIPRDRRLGFDYWKVLECTHDYNKSMYYEDSPEPLFWDGYDAVAQTRDVVSYIKKHDGAKPFFFMLSWGPPHTPHGGPHAAPEKYRAFVPPANALATRENVPEEMRAVIQRQLSGYYAHIAALDDCMGELLKSLKEAGLEKDTILIFTSDHGYMLGSQNERYKQSPWEESIHVPFLVRWPALHGENSCTIDAPINAPDLMPTILGLAGVPIPKTVEGIDFSPAFYGEPVDSDGAALISCPVPFGQWNRERGGREFRGVRTRTHTYVRDLNGPWLLYDNAADPFQMNNKVNQPESAGIQAELEVILQRKLRETNDDFRDEKYYMDLWKPIWEERQKEI